MTGAASQGRESLKRAVIGLIVLAVPVLFFANVLQAYRYNQLARSLTELEKEQQVLLEQNKRAILAISVLSSPDRIGQIATEELDLTRLTPDEILHLLVPANGADQ